jgi:hypothetical protein
METRDQTLTRLAFFFFALVFVGVVVSIEAFIYNRKIGKFRIGKGQQVVDESKKKGSVKRIITHRLNHPPRHIQTPHRHHQYSRHRRSAVVTQP